MSVQVASVPPPIVFAGLLQLQDERTIEVELHGLRFSGSYWCCGNLGPEPDSVISYQGEISYLGGRGDLQHVEVDTALTHQSFFRGGSATVSGRMGSSSIPATPHTPGASQRCSLPREGCGPLANGNAPCTLYPACRR